MATAGYYLGFPLTLVLLHYSYIGSTLKQRIMQLFSSLIGMLALGSSAVHATAWVAGYQSSGYTGWNIRQVGSIIYH